MALGQSAQRINMGLGALGSRDVVFKRKYRWTFQVDNICGGKSIPPSFVKLASRPNISIEETEINFLNGKFWIPGKGSWETITVTYYDVGGNVGDGITALYTWLAAVYQFNNPVTLKQGSRTADYSARARINMYDGCGTSMETWTLGDAWPQAINFGDLDYSSSEEATIEITLRYSQVEFNSTCPPINFADCCTGC